jgi:hypothetical protein
MIRHLLVLLALSLPFALVACPPSGDDDDSSATDDDDAVDDDDGADDDDAVVEGPFVTGVVQDPAGGVLEGIAMTLCDENRCLSTATQADGSFQFSTVPDGEYVVHNLSVPGIGDDPAAILDWAAFYDIAIVAGADVDMGTRVIPEIAEAFAVTDGANSHDFAGNLNVSWDGVFEPPLAAGGLDDITLGAVAIPEANWPDAVTGTPLAVFAFAPFESALEADGHFQISIGQMGLSDGDDVSLLYADYDEDIATGMLSTAAATVTLDGAVEGEVSHLGLLVVTMN